MLKSILIAALIVGAYMSSILNETENNTLLSERKKIFSRIKSSFCRKKRSAPILYYSSHSARFQLLISGDVETNPGPTTCGICERTVRKNSHQNECSQCFTKAHSKCITTQSSLNTNWMCTQCTNTLLPFFNSRDLVENPITNVPNNERDVHLNILNGYRNKISIAHLNTRSVTSSFPEFEAMLSKHQFDITTLSETWLKDNAKLLQHVNIQGYQFEFVNRPNKRGGGVGLYIKEALQYKVRKDIGRKDTTIEHLWIEVKNAKKHCSFLVGVCYQPSSLAADKEVWIDKLDHLLSHITTTWTGAVILTGDMNININNKNSPVTARYIETLTNHGLLHMSINRHVMEVKLSTTLHPMLGTFWQPTCFHVMRSVIMTRLTSSSTYVNRFAPRFKYIRREKDIDINAFKTDVERLPFNLVYAVECPDEKVDIFNKLFVSCLNEHAPLTKTKITRPPAPWLKDLDINQLQKQRDFFRKRAHDTQLDSDWKLFRETRNDLKKRIRTTKRDFYKSALTSKRPKEVWSTIHRILNPNPEKIDADVDKLNNHFNSTATRLLGSVSKPEHHLQSIIENLPLHENEFMINETTYDDVRKAIQ